jgi:K+-transporting ATPase KdpF subunit
LCWSRWFSSHRAWRTRTWAKGFEPMFEVVVGLIGLILIGYLLAAMLRPERF